ncbi:T9SS type A sorting domain-containing protein [Flavitalea flava]
MAAPLTLTIKSPCHEDWANMQTNGTGRHCAACQKVVVDFTSMTDAEIIHHLALAGKNICGRLAKDQLNRQLTPLSSLSPPKRNQLPGWQLLLAGFLLTADPSEPHGHARQEIGGFLSFLSIDFREKPTMGMVMIDPDRVCKPVDSGKVVQIPVVNDTNKIEFTQNMVVGDISVVVDDSIPTLEKITRLPVLDSLDSSLTLNLPQPPNSRQTLDSTQTPDFPQTPKTDSAGEPADGQVFKGFVVVARRSPKDTVQQLVTDTLTALRLLPKKQLKVYPNPVHRGGSIRIAWPTEPGTYQAELFSVAGTLIERRVMTIGSTTQVDNWEIPSSVAAGTYIIRATLPGKEKVYTQQLIVE